MRDDELRRILAQSAEQQRRMMEALQSPGMQAFVKQAAEQQRRVSEALQSPGMQAFAKQVAEQQRRMMEALQSPGMQAFVQQAAEQQRRASEALESPGMQAFVQQAAEQQRRMMEALQSPGMQAFVQQAAEQQRRMMKALESPGMQAFVQQAAEQQQRLRDMFSSFAKASQRIVEAYRAWDEAERRILDLLVPRGWLISPGTSLSEIHELLRVYDEEGLDAVEEALVATLNPDRCRTIVEGLYDRPSFAVWRPVLDQALVAHEQGMYSLAVPVWLLALDGIVFAELGVDNVYVRVQRKKGAAVREQLTFGPRTRLVDALITVIRTVAGHLPRGTPPTPGELRRHVILHGLDPEYGTEKASIQGVLLLEVLHFQLEASTPPAP